MTSLSPRLYVDLIGKRYAPNARGPSAYDCLGLAIELSRRRGLEVPEFASSEQEMHRQIAGGGYLAALPAISGPECGCLVMMRSTCALQVHLGVMLDSFWMLHASEIAGGVVRERLQGSPWARRILAYYHMGAPA